MQPSANGMNQASTTKLVALDSDDLEVISAHLQDAVLRVGDVRWLKRERKLAFVANRYDHLDAGASTAHGTGKRKLTGVQLSTVNRVAANNITMDDKSAILSLLSVGFEAEGAGPEGVVTLTFAGGGAIRAEVECIEIAMADLGPSWAARARPEHETDIAPEDGSK